MGGLSKMYFKFWGVRGSVATPDKDKLKYGGNTTCFEYSDDLGNTVIFDAGSGIRRLGKTLIQSNNHKKIYLFFTHYHWDHTQGLPFFQPIYRPDTELIMYGAKRGKIGINEALAGQLSRLYFPVSLEKMSATKKFIDLGSNETVKIGNSKIHVRSLNHPQGCLGFKIENGDKVITICTDTEHVEGKLNKNVLFLAENSDLFIYDCHYTPEEYDNGHQGWGHSTYEEGIKIVNEINAKKFVLFHHDPDHNDTFMDEKVRKAKELFPESYGAIEGEKFEF